MPDDIVERMEAVRDFPSNTCGASRHAQIIAEALLKRDPYPMLTEEPEHCGESIAATVEALWKVRTELRAALAERAPNLACKSVQKRLAEQWGYTHPAPERVAALLAAERERPEWVHCVGFGSAIRTDGKRTWCGRDEHPFFWDVDHAALNGAHGGRLVACRACVAAIVDGLTNGHDDPEYASA